jgi:hypothetical protein
VNTTQLIKNLLQHSTPGAKSVIDRHIQRGTIIADSIARHFGEGMENPRRWQAKHLQWFLKVHTPPMKRDTSYDYWRSCRTLASALGKWPDWEPHLRGNWNPHPHKGQGGRPAKLPGNAKPKPAPTPPNT